jgi:predicted outer membrane protein
MSKRIALLVVLTFLVGGTAFTQQQDRTTDRQGQTTKSKQDTKTQKDTMSTMQQGDTKIGSDDRNFIMKAAESGMEEVEMGQLALKQASSEEVKQFAQHMIDDHSKANSELMQLAQSKGITLPATMSSGTGDNMNSSGQSSSSTISQQSSGTGQQTGGTTGQQNNKTGSGQQNDRAGSGQQNDRTGSMASGQDSSTAMKGSSDHKKMMDKMGKLSGADFDREYIKQQVADHDKAVSLFEKQSKNGKDPELRAFADRTLPALKEHQQTVRNLNSKVGGKTDSSRKDPK